MLHCLRVNGSTAREPFLASTRSLDRQQVPFCHVFGMTRPVTETSQLGNACLTNSTTRTVAYTWRNTVLESCCHFMFCFIEGEASVVSLISKTVIHRHHFRKPVHCVRYVTLSHLVYINNFRIKLINTATIF